jgi:hypothetical protein
MLVFPVGWLMLSAYYNPIHSTTPFGQAGYRNKVTSFTRLVRSQLTIAFAGMRRVTSENNRPEVHPMSEYARK